MRTDEVARATDALGRLLTDTLAVDDYFELGSLKKQPTIAPFDAGEHGVAEPPPDPAAYAVAPLSALQRLVPVESIDRATGRPARTCVVTVRTSRDVFGTINLAQVDPAACLKALNASVSKSPAELAPVRPVLEFTMVDPRFIDEVDVLSGLDQRPNLMELTPSEFEALIANLFGKMGLETRVTQASRDGGVDCVAFDPRPIFGGKVVIQAKRYKHTVGVSAVRDLFGTVQNEGASKGILVTTSGYGKAAFEFADGKPLELLSGSNLLHLLAEHAGIEARIEMPADWKDPQPDVAN